MNPKSKPLRAGEDPADATSSSAPVPDFAAGLANVSDLSSRPLQGRRLGVIAETSSTGAAKSSFLLSHSE